MFPHREDLPDFHWNQVSPLPMYLEKIYHLPSSSFQHLNTCPWANPAHAIKLQYGVSTQGQRLILNWSEISLKTR